MKVPQIEFVHDDLLRRERQTSLNRLPNLPDWESGKGLSEIMKELRDNVCIHRKSWEYAICIDGLTKLGCVKEGARAIAIGAGYEKPLFYFANRIQLMVASDLYDNPSHEGKPEMLTQPESFAPFPYRKENLWVLRLSGDDLKFPDNCFDFAFSLSSIEHFGPRETIRKAFGEMLRVLKPGGVLCLATELILNGVTDYECFTPTEIEDIFLSRGDAELVGGDFDFRIQKSLMEYPIDLSDPEMHQISPHIVLRKGDLIATSVSMFFRKRP